MNSRVLILAAATSLLFTTFSSQAASFNCKKASNATERAICANQRLNEADTKLDSTYTILMRFDGDNQRIKQDQKNWLRGRNQCGSRVACISEEYQHRQTELEQEIGRYQGG